jgi:hypothetical protein
MASKASAGHLPRKDIEAIKHKFESILEMQNQKQDKLDVDIKRVLDRSGKVDSVPELHLRLMQELPRQYEAMVAEQLEMLTAGKIDLSEYEANVKSLGEKIRIVSEDITKKFTENNGVLQKILIADAVETLLGSNNLIRHVNESFRQLSKELGETLEKDTEEFVSQGE